MFKKLTYAVTISALAALSLATVASASGPYASFTIANGDANEENSNDVDTKVQAAITTEQPSKLNVRGGDDSDMPSINVGSEPVKLNIGGGDDNDMPRVRLHVGASDPAEQA